MKKIILIAAAVLSLAACSKKTAYNLAEAVKNVTVECEPGILTLAADSIKASFKVNYPAGYYTPDAMVVISPYLVYDGGEMAGKPFSYQGEGVKANNRVIPVKGGSTATETVVFPYLNGMDHCRLELRSAAFMGGVQVQVPPIKVADGLVILVKYAEKQGEYDYKPDNYQETVIHTAEGRILYDVNSSDVKNSQLGSSSIKDLENAIAEGNQSDRVKVKGTKIISYASPEGGEELNSKLSDKRSEAARQAWKKIGKGAEAGSTEVKSIGQDWEGFQEAISKSDLEDKDLILRVLSMYSDPAVRENEIKNLSQVYTEIKQDVFPELRRSRFITEMEYQNYSSEDLKKLLNRKRLYLLDEEALLHLASITDSLEVKQMLYRAAADRMGSERGRYNLGITLLKKNSPSAADAYFSMMENQKDPDLLNAKGVIALRANRLDDAQKLFMESTSPLAKANLGLVYLLKGKWEDAAAALEGTGDRNEAIADIYVGKYDEALKVLDRHSCPLSYYLRAIACARKGDQAGVTKYLGVATSKAPALKKRAEKDIEFAGFDI